jgi:hypothetical protein
VRQRRVHGRHLPALALATAADHPADAAHQRGPKRAGRAAFASAASAVGPDLL